jgi:hypothetical protein
MQGLLVTQKPSRNEKLTGGRDDVQFYATYRAVGRSCPTDCVLLNNGCYAQGGNVNLHQRERVSETDGEIFAREIDRIPSGSVVRLHVSGDVMRDQGLNGSTAVDTDYLQAIVDTARARPDITFYGYTHAWKRINRNAYAWPDNLTLNASVDRPEDMQDAVSAGWPITTVVPSDTEWKRQGDTVVCPAQTSGLSCAECMLCAKPKRSLRVAFRAHGASKRKADGAVALPTV